MTPARLLAHFDRLADAPDAVPRLRRFVLDLAVRGKLVPQDPADEPAADLLKQIATEKSKFLKQAGARAITPIDTADGPHAIPDGWLWVRFGDVVFSRDGERIPVSKEERNTRAKTYDYYGASGVIDKIDGFLFDKPLLLIGEDGANLINRSTPIAFIARGKYWVNNHAHVLDGISEQLLRYLELHINAIDLKPYVTGTAQPKMNQAKMNSIPIALPPLAEQRRIVEKVDELMALCDQLDAAQAERESRRDRLAGAALARLNQPADDATAFRDHARFALDHLPRLTTRPEHVAPLRQTILNLAVRGKLVPQDPTDEPAAELLKRIDADQAQSQRSRARGRVGTQPQESEPFVVPASWEWVPLQRLIVFGPQNGISPKPTTNPDAPRAVTLSATTKGTFDATAWKRVEASIPKNSDLWLRDGDLLFQRGNTREYVGIAAVYSGKPGVLLYPDLMIKVRVSPHLCLPFIHLAVVSPYARDYFSRRASGAQASMPKINHGILNELPVTLPPLAEQRRIVARVDELMAVCDQLDAHLTAAQADRGRLLDAVLHDALHAG